MGDLRTTYMGLELSSPIIAGSSGLNNNLRNLLDAEKHGAGAVVLKSLFEEQINHEMYSAVNSDSQNAVYPEAMDYLSNYTKQHSVANYLKLIREAKENLSIPVIASINCLSANEWINFASQIEEAGADALELNLFILPSDPFRSGEENEKVYFDIIQEVRKKITIPLSVKISFYFSGLGKTILHLSWTGISGLVLFNRFYSPDIDINEMEVTTANVFSSPNEIYMPLRWIAMLSDHVQCDLCASTGVENGESAVKLILAGATAVQVTSALYKYGISKITDINDQISDWMKVHGYTSINDFKGKMSLKKAQNPAAYERVQFMKHFAGIE
ncbi:MAG: dihydroorotate dehydrogenase-like protein [Bacteroidales bacterium]|nr:dihydroorotate dehydrogenase-like protein [Bacteroidales bacterium]